MKQFKTAAAFAVAAIMVIAMATAAFAIAIIDEDGNIVQGNEVLPGGIMPLVVEFDGVAGDGYDWPDGYDWNIVWPAFGFATGEVVEFWQNDRTGYDGIRIRNALGGEWEGYYSYFDFVVDMNTFKMGGEIKIGDTITGFFDNNVPVILIYPPQHNVAVVLVNRTEDLPRVIVDRFDENWVSSAQEFRLRINEDTPIYFQGGEAFDGEIEELIGRKLVVEFSVSHRDIPETIPRPEKITVLYERAVHPVIEIDWDSILEYVTPEYNAVNWDSIEWWSEDSDPANYDIIITINGLARGVPNANAVTIGDSIWPNYVPLRAVTEMLGFAPRWHSAVRGVTVGSPRGEISMTIGQPYYIVDLPGGISATYVLEDVPIIINGRTYVPLRFFRDVYGFNNAWWAHGNISLDNAERME